MARWNAPAVWPPHLARYDPAAWVDRYAWAMARWEYYEAHPDMPADPIALLTDRYNARREVAYP